MPPTRSSETTSDMKNKIVKSDPLHFEPGYDSLSFEEKRCARVLQNMYDRNDTDLFSLARRLDRSEAVTEMLVMSTISKVKISFA